MDGFPGRFEREVKESFPVLVENVRFTLENHCVLSRRTSLESLPESLDFISPQ